MELRSRANPDSDADVLLERQVRAAGPLKDRVEEYSRSGHDQSQQRQREQGFHLRLPGIPANEA